MPNLNDTLQRLKSDHVASDKKESNVCPKCNGTTWIITRGEDGREYGKPCECRNKVIATTIMQNCGITPEDQHKGFKDFNTFGEKALIHAKQIAMSYFQMFRGDYHTRINSLLLSGASGRGKTMLGLAVANNLMNMSIRVRYMAYRDEMTALKQNIVDEYAYNERINRLKNASVLFIDDLLKGKITESDVNILYEIVNYRYLQRLPMIISTEKTIEELINFDEAIGSRIAEMSKDYVITFDASVPNYRLR